MADRPPSSLMGLGGVLWPGATADLLAGQVHHQRTTRWLTLGFNLAAPP